MHSSQQRRTLSNAEPYLCNPRSHFASCATCNPDSMTCKIYNSDNRGKSQCHNSLCLCTYPLGNLVGGTLAPSCHLADALYRYLLELSRPSFRALVCRARKSQCMETTPTTPTRHRVISHRRNLCNRNHDLSPDCDRCSHQRPKSHRSVSRCALPPQ